MRLSSPATRCLPAFSPQQQICQRKQEPEQSCQVALWLVAVPANSGNTNRETSAKHSRRVILQDSSASMCLLPDCLRRSKNSRCVLLLARSDFRSTSHLKQSALQLDGGGEWRAAAPPGLGHLVRSAPEYNYCTHSCTPTTPSAGAKTDKKLLKSCCFGIRSQSLRLRLWVTRMSSLDGL